MDDLINELIKSATEALKKSYSPYSKFKVGAAILTKNNKIFTGANVENASYSLTICAERVAGVKAISSGESKFKYIAIATNRNEIAFPCGACLQFLIEFSQNLKVILVKTEKKYKIFDLKELLPKNFTL
ncbi:MAG: cytidine deaminase [Ignavibacteriae bacterium]|nr:cytidine deaminase [Ignavibacteriota bacterium]